jgi:uncharacterized repeat protein (TIGR01451 family)
MRVLFNLFASAALIGGVMLLPAALTLAEAKPIITFEPGQGYIPGSIDGQQGWGGSGTPVDPLIDQAVVLNTAYPAAATGTFATQSFRMSNAHTSGSFGDQVFSPSLTDEAGELSAVSDGFADGARQTRFEATWDFTSATGAPQPGLSTVVSPDRGDGARMSWIQMTDTGGTGLEVNFQDYQRGVVEPVGTCVTGDNFVVTNVATGLSRTSAHEIKLQMDFIDGPANDIVRVWVDGALVHTGTSWEDYFRECEGNPTRPVDSVLFRVGGTAAPGTIGNGFLFDNLTLFSGPRDIAADLSVSKTDSPDPVHIGQKLTYTVVVTNNGPDAATGVSLIDNLPKNAGFGSATSTQGTCTVKPAKAQVTCSLGTLASGRTATVTIVVKPTKKGTITNTATVSSTSPADPNTLNNTVRQDTVVLP